MKPEPIAIRCFERSATSGWARGVDPKARTAPRKAPRKAAARAASGAERVTLLGYSLGCQIVLEAWRRLPDPMVGLVCILGTAGRPFDHFYGPVLGRLAHGLLRAAPDRAVGVALRLTCI